MAHFCPSSSGRAVASTGWSLHNTLTLLGYLMTHTGAGPHALSPAHVCTCAQAIATFRSRSSRVCDSAGLLSVQIVTGGTERRLGVLLFVFLPSDDVSDESAPPSAHLPYRVLRSAHSDHVHTGSLL